MDAHLGSNAVLQPVVALVVWSLVMMLWMYATRIPAMLKAGTDLKSMVGGTGTRLDEMLEARVQWKAHNYNHLMEQPTLFYAIAISLALLGHGDGFSLALAWLYVGLRVAHSLLQATVNVVRWRFLLFVAASICLLALTVEAAAVLLCPGWPGV
jgi:hypothetical protein